jgi:uncharacterized membrane protein YedE/YeeE
MIGVSASILWAVYGRVAGITGIVGEAADGNLGARAWRLYFVGGLVAGGIVAALLVPSAFGGAVLRAPAARVAAGLLVGFGTRLSNGCTSGHGVCGIARLSKRSIVATVVFMVAGMATVGVARHLAGGGGA